MVINHTTVNGNRCFLIHNAQAIKAIIKWPLKFIKIISYVSKISLILFHVLPSIFKLKKVWSHTSAPNYPFLTRYLDTQTILLLLASNRRAPRIFYWAGVGSDTGTTHNFNIYIYI